MGRPWEITDIELDEPKADDVRIKFLAAGLCHSDDHIQKGDAQMRFPVVGGKIHHFGTQQPPTRPSTRTEPTTVRVQTMPDNRGPPGLFGRALPGVPRSDNPAHGLVKVEGAPKELLVLRQRPE